MKVQKRAMVIKMIQQNNLFVSRTNNLVYLCNTKGQKMIVTDKNIAAKSDDEIIKHYQAFNIFKESNERRC